MSWSDFFLFCLVVGALWTFVTLLLGGVHLGHFAHGHTQVHVPGKFVSAAHGHAHAHAPSLHGHLWSMVNPSALAAFLAWFGGVGYVLTRHSGWAFWLDLTIAIAVGLMGAWLLGSFLRFLQSRETVMDPLDDEFIGVLGEVTCPLRPDGVGELIFVRQGARRALPARSEDGELIERGREVIVTRYEKGIAYVRTWEAMTQEARR